jgi:archaellum biogenesis ATPase FlaH
MTDDSESIDRNYTEAKQKLLIDILMSSDDVFTRCQNILKASYWSAPFRPAMRFILDYVSKNTALPKIQHLNAETNGNFEIIADLNTFHVEAFLKEIEEFCKNRALAEAVVAGMELIKKGNYGELEKRIKDAVLISLVSDVGTNYFADPRTRLMAIKANNGQVSTGWKTVDHKLYGGINKGEITIWCAGSGVGKSLFLQNICLQLVKQQLNVIYISLELSEGLSSMRIDSMLTGISTTDIFKKLDDVELKVIQAGRNSGSLHVKQMSQGSTTNDIKAYLKAYEIETGKRPDAVVVDYLDLLYPNNKKINPSDLFIRDKYVTEELRGLAVERKMICQTASQLNRCLTLDTLVVRNGKRIPIDQLNVGDYIENEAGPVRVTEILPIVKQAVFEITTKSGKTIKVSSKHLFPTEDGLKNLESGLQVGDKLRSRLHK